MMRALFAAVALLFVQAAQALDFEVRQANGERWVQASGYIEAGDGRAFLAMTRDLPGVNWIVFDSPGGGVRAAIALGHAVRNRGFAALVPSNARCLSACFFAFIGGRDRVVKGELGVHQFYGGAAADAGIAESEAQFIVADLVEYVLAMGVSMEALNVAFRTPSDDMHIFTEDELVRFSLHLAEPPAVAEADCPFPPGHVVADPLNMYPGCKNRR